MKVGFLGTGLMGRPMAGHLQAAGHALYLMRHRSPLPQELLDRGAAVCGSRRELAEIAEVIITMLPDTPEVENALFGEGGVAEGLSPGKVVVDMSSIHPFATRTFAERVKALGCDYLDAPVSGGEVGAKEASLSIMCGGEPAVFERVRPLFEAMGRNITLVGPSGSGQVAKVTNQIIVALNMEAVAEALVFASKAGADPAKVREALMGGFASSRVLEVHGDRMIRRAFEPGGKISTHQKDLDLALDMAKTLDIALPGAALTQQLFSACAARGLGPKDQAALVRALEVLSDHEIGPAPP